MDISKLGITAVDVFLQPIVSVNKNKIFGYEALVRAYSEESYISPPLLFSQAEEQKLCVKLDSSLHVLAIKKFHSYFLKDEKTLLFLNFQATSINENFKKEQYNFEELLQELGIPSKNVVLEIKEDSVENTNALIEFTAYYKERGFIIAIDDFGAGSSQYERLAIVEPDIVKIDRSLLVDIADNYINAEIVKSVASMCHRIGATVLAEGVENESEILKCLNFDIQIYQGYWFSRPKAEIKNSLEILQKIEKIRIKHGQYLKEIMLSNRALFLEASSITDQIVKKLNRETLLDNSLVQEILTKNGGIEALYIIEVRSAQQIGKTLFLAEEKGFYEPSVSGDDHSLKEYFYICKNSKDGDYMSKKYISAASGNLCKTYSKKVSLEQNEYIVCLDIHLENKQKNLK